MNTNDVSVYCTLQVFVVKRDRQSLSSYTATLHPQSEDYLYAEYALRVSVRFYFNANVVKFNCIETGIIKCTNCVETLIAMDICMDTKWGLESQCCAF
jgi:hypothetical protein